MIDYINGADLTGRDYCAKGTGTNTENISDGK